MSRSVKVAAIVSTVTVLVIYAVMSEGHRARATRALDVLPATARAVVRIDPQALERSAAARSLLGAFVDAAELSEIEARCGLDPLTDLSEVIVWVRGSESQPFQAFGVQLTGRRTDAAGIADCHRKLVEARGGSIVRLEAPNGPVLASDDQSSAIAVLGTRTVATGSVQTVSETMAVQRGLLPALAQRARIATLWRDVSPGAAIAVAFDPPEHWRDAIERAGNWGANASAMEGIEAVAVVVKPGPAQTLEIYLDVATPQLAARSAAAVRNGATSPTDHIEPPWESVLRSAKARVIATRVVITIDVSSLGGTS